MKKHYKTELIEEFRKENRLSVERFCKQCNICMATYYKIMHQQLNFRSSVMFKIARAMGVEMKRLYY